jgi:non-homologous end joining protein Ku
VRPLDGVLTMAMLNDDAEIRKPLEIKSEFKRPRLAPNKVKLAENLVAKWKQGKVDFADYEDRYRQKVKQAWRRRRRGRKSLRRRKNNRK